MTVESPKSELKLPIRLGGKGYSVICNADSVDELTLAAEELEERMAAIRASAGMKFVTNENVLVLVALNLLAELQRGDSVEMGEVADDFDSQIQEFSSWVRDTIPESRAAQRFLSSAKS